LFDIGPSSVLREDGPDDNFKAGLGRPPMLGAVCRKHRIEKLMENGLGRGWARRGFPARMPKRLGPRLVGGWQNRTNNHLFRKIAVEPRQVKVERLSAETDACPGVQVLANSQLGSKIERRRLQPFAMLGVRCTEVRECSGCPSV
jgi:hypothetical protein